MIGLASFIPCFDDFDEMKEIVCDLEKGEDSMVIEYSKEEGKRLVPSGSFVGEGKYGKIVDHAGDEKLVIKTSLEEEISLQRELMIV